MTRLLTWYDTTLRDGAQSDGVDFSVRDKLSIARRLDDLGMDYIELGWPGANRVDSAAFEQARDLQLRKARLAAFGSTHRAGHRPEQDATMQALAACCAPVITIFGKSCPQHVRIALGITREENLALIADSVAWLKARKEELIYDAEHFFDGFKRDADYALATLRAAHENGAAVLTLCDTNGGSMPEDISAIIARVRRELPQARIGIHAHNDCGLAVANTLAAVAAGAELIQGTINGIGERCGNADLCTIIPNLLLKSPGHSSRHIDAAALRELAPLSYAVCDIANIAPNKWQPFVGNAAFAHKGGIHVSAVNKNSELYEHISPESIGNTRRILISQQGGKSNISALAKRLGIDLPADSPALAELSAIIKENASRGYDYAAAEASAELLLRRHLGQIPEYFSVKRFYVINSHTEKDPEMAIEACLKLDVNGHTTHVAASGLGPVDALERALRRALLPFYPELEGLNLIDYKVRVLAGLGEAGCTVGPGSVRVLIDSSDGGFSRTTVGVSADLIEASWNALTDAFIYHLHRHRGAPAADPAEPVQDPAEP